MHSCVSRRLGFATSLVATLWAPRALANGHGPVYGLATPTLPEGSWSLDVGSRARLAGTRSDNLSVRPMVSYGLTSDVQLSASVPMPIYSRGPVDPVRMMALMPAQPDVEALVGWRFHHQAGLGSRFEARSTLGWITRSRARSQASVRRRQPWGSPGHGLRLALDLRLGWRALPAVADGLGRDPHRRSGHGIAGARLPPFVPGSRRASCRLEGIRRGVGEYTFPDEVQGQTVPGTGGTEVLVGPTVLGLFGAWGISGGRCSRSMTA